MEETNHDGDALGAKSHFDIVGLLQDIKELESNIQKFEVKEDVIDIQQELGIGEFNEPEISKQIPIEQPLPIVPLPEIPEELLESEKIEKKVKKFFSEELPARLHLKEAGVFLKKKVLRIPDEDPFLPRATFTLNIDNSGNLVGFDIPNPNQQNLIKSIVSAIKNKSKSSSKEESAPKGIVGKITGIFTKIIPKKGEGESESSGIFGKIKGILPGK